MRAQLDNKKVTVTENGTGSRSRCTLYREPGGKVTIGEEPEMSRAMVQEQQRWGGGQQL